MPLQEAGQFFAVVTGLAFPILSTEQELEKKRRVNAEVVEENFEVGGGYRSAVGAPVRGVGESAR